MPEEEPTTSIEQVAEVLQQLKREVRQQHHRPDDIGVLAGEPTVLLDRPAPLEAVHSTMRVNPHLPIAWPDWPKGLWPKIVALVQKVIRRLLRWYIDPIVMQQNRHNAAVTRALDMLWGEIVRLQVQMLQEQHRRQADGK